MIPWSEPLRATVVALPFAAVAAVVAARLVGARIRDGEIALWLAWTALALGHARLGLEGSALVVAAAGFALAAFRTAALVPAFARRRAPHARLVGAAFAAAFAFLLLLWPWSGAGRAPDGDEPYYLLLTESLASDSDVDLADEYRLRSWAAFSPVEIQPQPGDPTGPAGELWSRHTAFLPLLLVLFHRLGGYAADELAMVALAAALAAAIFALVRARYPRARLAAPAAWAIATLAPPLFVYSGRLWVEVPAALAVALALLAIERRRSWLLFAALAALPLLKLRFLALALPIFALAAVRFGLVGRRRDVVRLASGLGFLLAALALWNTARYGNPLRMYGLGDLDLTALAPEALARGLAGLGFDSAFGLFALAPVWLLVFPGAVEGLRRRALPVVELLAAVPYVAFIAARREWYGGWSPPFRYGVVLLPLLALALAPLFLVAPRTAGLRRLIALLLAATAMSGLVAFLHPAWTFSLADGASRPLAELSERFTGDLVRFTPSLVRPRLATVVWLAAIPLAIVAARARRPRRFARASVPLAAALLLGGGALWLHAAARVPTRVVELEDGWVAKRGGGIYPGRWTVDRTRFAGGWVLTDGAAASFVPAGSGTARLRVRASHYGEPGERATAVPLTLVVDERVVATFPPPREAETWAELESAPVALARGARVVVAAGDSTAARVRQAGPFWIVDRIELVR